MAVNDFLEALKTVAKRAAEGPPPSTPGKPEEGTKDRLLTPLFETLGYGPDERTLEGAIKSLNGTTAWIDYYLKSQPREQPWLMIEAKPFEQTGLWTRHQKQVLDYIRDYASMVGTEKPVHWILLTNYREWHFVRLGEREPFWSITHEDLADEAVARQLYRVLAREELHHERLLELFHEKQRDALTERTSQFLSDLKVWRAILANGIRNGNPALSLEEIQYASHVLLLRVLLVRLVETYGNEPFFWLGRTYDFWKAGSSLPFVTQLNLFFRDSWAKYNTELFAETWVDKLDVPGEYFELVIQPNAVPDAAVTAQLGSRLVDYRSIYNYDFSTLEHDILGTAYEQFLAHELVETSNGIQIADNPETRKREGIFYTPAHIVRKIVREVVGPQVDPYKEKALEMLGEEKFDEAFLEAKKIFEVRVVDPACGSGSFLLAAHSYISEAVREYNHRARELMPASRAPATPVSMFDATTTSTSSPRLVSRPEERVLMDCIYGVDLDAEAVGLAKLTLWTQLLRLQPDVYGRRGVSHSQLPALGLNIRQGNSLIHAPSNLTAYQSDIETNADLTKVVKNPSVEPGERRAALKSYEALVEALRISLEPDVIDHFENPQAISVFTWQVEFPEIFDPRLAPEDRGFTAVIGNPPYFNVDSTYGVNAEETAWLQVAFPDVYTDKTDILFYFFVRGLEILRRDGSFGLIVSRSFLQGDKSLKLREFLASRARLDHILDFQGSRVFEAGIATAIVIATNSTPPEGHAVMVDFVLDYESLRQALLRNDDTPSGLIREEVPQQSLEDGNWILSPYRTTIFRLIDEHKPLSEHVVEIGQGMQTGKNDVFVVSSDELQSMLLPQNSPFVKPRASNTNLTAFGVVPIDEYVLWTEDHEFNDLPAGLQTYLEENREALEGRAAYTRGNCRWYQFTWPLHKDKHFKTKLMHSYRGPSNQFVVDEQGSWLGLTNTTHVYVDQTSIDPYALAALLNSEVATFRMVGLGGLAKLTGPGTYEFFQNQLDRLPVPDLTQIDEATLAELGRAAHTNFRSLRSLHEAFQAESLSLTHTLESLAAFSDPAGPYANMLSITSPNANEVGHLLSVTVEADASGFTLVGRVTTEDDWEQGTQVVMPLARFESSNSDLMEFLLHRAHFVAHISPEIKRKAKLTGAGIENLFRAALEAISIPLYDQDPVRNIATIATITKRVQAKTGGQSLGGLLREREEVLERINQTAYKLYGVTSHIATIRSALIQDV